MRFTPALEAALEARNAPVITALDFHLLAADLFTAAQWRGEPLQRLPKAWDQRRSAAMISRLIRREALASDHDAGHGVYRVLAADDPGTAEQIACLVDPFCYVAYASALHVHGLVATRPTPLQIVTPAAAQWRALHTARQQDLVSNDGEYPQHYARIRLGDRLRRRSIVVHETVTPVPIATQGPVRVSTLAATFADTLVEPARCGGMAAVLKIWDRHARGHVPEIVAALAGASKIVKVRAGHIFTERLGVETPEILSWQAFAQRGGSRRLDPEQPYAPTFSARWMLSLNA